MSNSGSFAQEKCWECETPRGEAETATSKGGAQTANPGLTPALPAHSK